MSARRRRHIWPGFVALLLVVLTAGAGLAHYRPPTVQESRLAAFALMGFGPADLCGMAEADGAEDGACRFCQPAAQALPVPPAAVPTRGVTAATRVVPLRRADWSAARFDPARPSRGPPDAI